LERINEQTKSEKNQLALIIETQKQNHQMQMQAQE
jgi:hypothetical protein